MNELETQLKLQAFVDGELPAREAAEVEALLARDPAAKRLVAEFSFTKAALRGNEPVMTLPESREFHWSKIAREIERIESAEKRTSGAERGLAAWLRLLVPIGAAAMLAIAFLAADLRQTGELAGAETALHLPGLSFYSTDENMTVVWVDSGINSEVDLPEKESTIQAD